MVILAQGRQEIFNVEILFVNRDWTVRHFRTIIIAHKFIERVEAGNNLFVLTHFVKEHRECRAKFAAFSLAYAVVLRLPQRQQQCLDAVLFLHVEHPVVSEKRIK